MCNYAQVEGQWCLGCVLLYYGLSSSLLKDVYSIHSQKRLQNELHQTLACNIGNDLESSRGASNLN